MKKIIRNVTHLREVRFHSLGTFKEFDGSPLEVKIENVNLKFESNDGRVWSDLNQVPRNLKFRPILEIVIKESHQIEEYE